MTCKMKSRFVALSLCLMGFSFVPVCGQIGMPSHSIVNPDSVSHNFYERETVKGNTITYKVDYSYPMLYCIGNACNTRLGELMSLKDGSTPTEPVDRGGIWMWFLWNLSIGLSWRLSPPKRFVCWLRMTKFCLSVMRWTKPDRY